LLGDRRVPDPRRPELLEQARGRLEHPARRADVLPQAHDRGVAAHLPGDALGHRLPVGGQVRHAEPPSAHTSVNASPGSGGGAALAAAIAWATVSAARTAAWVTDAAGTPASASRRRASSSGSRASHSATSSARRYL